MTGEPRTAAFSLPHVVAFLAMIAAAGLAAALAPSKVDLADRSLDLNALVPKQVGRWQDVPSPFVQMDLSPRRDGEEHTTTDRPYDQTVMRTYRRSDGATVMLALAYGSRQLQEVKIHRPELCYAAQGFQVTRAEAGSLDLRAGQRVAITRLLTRGPARMEPVTYWIRIGDEITKSAWQSRLAILREGLRGRVPDGILVRVSSAYPRALPDRQDAYEIQAEFLRELLSALDPRGQRLLLGGRAA